MSDRLRLLNYADYQKNISRRRVLREILWSGVVAAAYVAAGCGDDPTATPEPPIAPATATMTPRIDVPTTVPITAEATAGAVDVPTTAPVTVTTEAAVGASEIHITQKEQNAAYEVVRQGFGQWNDQFVTTDGTTDPDELRVKRPQNDSDTVSEGQAYGANIAAFVGDQETFDRIWKFSKNRLNSNGLMSWHMDAGGKVLDKNCATDADLDMAYALFAAGMRWKNGKYLDDAKQLINNIKAKCIEDKTFVLKPGDVWGGSDVTNPSYFTPAYFKIFGEITGDPIWKKVDVTSNNIIASAMIKGGAQNTGLVPDWTTADGGSTRDQPDGYKYSYDATRYPWRQAMAAIMFPNDPVGQAAIAKLQKINHFFETIGPDNIKAGFTLDGKPIEAYSNTAFWAPAYAASIVSPNAAYRNALFEKTRDGRDGYYYNEALRMQALMTVSGKMAKI